MTKKYDRNLKRYFTDIGLTLTKNCNRDNQKIVKKDHERDFKSLCMKVVPKIINNVTAFKN